MKPKKCSLKVRPNRQSIKTEGRNALAQIAGPLVQFMFSSGLSVRDLNMILREAAVRFSAARHVAAGRLVSNAGIAASTGIPRGEVSKILKRPDSHLPNSEDRLELCTNRILAAWHSDSKFVDARGMPMDLKIYGRGATFDSLSRNYGRGIPTRAILDELIVSRNVEVLNSGLVRAIASVASSPRFGRSEIHSFGVRVTDLMSTLLYDIEHSTDTKLLDCISVPCTSSNQAKLFRDYLSETRTDFFRGIHDFLIQSSASSVVEKTRLPIGQIRVTVFLTETNQKMKKKESKREKRKNFRRDIN